MKTEKLVSDCCSASVQEDQGLQIDLMFKKVFVLNVMSTVFVLRDNNP